MISQGGLDGPRPECTLCGVKYTARMSIRDHIFSKQHIAKVQETLGNQMDREKDYLAPTTVRQLMAQQEMDRLKKAGSDGLSNLAAQQLQTAVDQNNALHSLSLPFGYPGISGLPPVLLPGVNGPSSLPVYPPNTPALASPGAGMLGFPTPATPSPAMSLSTTPTKTLLQTSPPPPPPPPPLPPVSSTPLTSTNHIEQHSNYPERDSNNNNSSSSSKKPAEKPHHQKKAKEREVENGGRPQTPNVSNNKKKEKPSPASGKPGREGHLDAAQLQALQNALAGAADPSSFLGGQFLPYFLPGFANSFSPQLLGGMQAGGYFPPFGGMENMFPYGPAAIPQAAMAGMNPTALLQQYQQYQQSLQDSLQKQQQQQQQQQQQKQLEQKQHHHKQPKQKPAPVKASSPSVQSNPKSFKPKQSMGTKDDTNNNKCSLTESTKEPPTETKRTTDFPDAFIIPSVKHQFICRKCQMVFADEDSAVHHQKSFCYFGNPFPDPQETVLRKAVSKYRCIACNVMVNGNEALDQHLHSVSGVPTSLPNESCSDESDNELSQKLDELDKVLEAKAKSTSGLGAGFSSIRMDMFSV
ncbi:hypothetical protein J4Q44_G00295890 [Coregonus suidteri]|uniref:C2H2-type domain-containing protein n=1 Tax=Coregonus suidteri TaxID=861788 RepID=A0AAN8QI89_9TELE